MKKVLTCGFLICGLILSFAAACFGQIHNLQEVSPERKITALEPGQVIEREIGEPDFYRIKLDAGKFVKIEVEQTDCDVVLMFIRREGKIFKRGAKKTPAAESNRLKRPSHRRASMSFAFCLFPRPRRPAATR